MSFYPNSAKGKCLLSFETKEKIKQLSITLTDMLGHRLQKEAHYEVRGMFNKEIDVSALPQGVYFAEIRADGERVVKKLVVQ